jgi:ribosomal-protein-alanine N-acetyltransferase
MNPPATTWEIRSLRAGDVDAVYNLERRTDGAAHWPDKEYLRLAEPSAARGVQRIGAVAVDKGRVIGFIAGRLVLDEAEVENIAVEASLRRLGVAAALVDGFLHDCRHRRCSVARLEVRHSNAAARALYAAAGFREEARRAGYYRNPAEDAVIMSVRL